MVAQSGAFASLSLAIAQCLVPGRYSLCVCFMSVKWIDDLLVPGERETCFWTFQSSVRCPVMSCRHSLSSGTDSRLSPHCIPRSPSFAMSSSPVMSASVSPLLEAIHFSECSRRPRLMVRMGKIATGRYKRK